MVSFRRVLEFLLPYTRSGVYESVDIRALKGIVKLSENEAPWDPPEELIEVFRESFEGVRRYPHSGYDKLSARIAEYAGCEKEQVAVGSGAIALLDNAQRALLEPGDAVVFPIPTYHEAMRRTMLNYGSVRMVKRNEKFEIDAETVISEAKSTGAKMVYVCSPNNPTGTTTTFETTKKIAENIEGVVVVDEAYFEFCGETAKDLVREFDNVIVLRTFSKAFGMAGLRVGYALTSEKIAEAINKVRLPYDVNALAESAVMWMLDNEDYLEKVVEHVKSERARMFGELRAIEGLEPLPSGANFILSLARGIDTAAVQKELKSNGILINSFKTYVGLPESIRVGIGTREQNEMMMKMLKEAVGKFSIF
ncbi:MAG: histidinol-phosphate transaminase [Candidatus Micrarchaeota archaeon]